MYVQHSESPPFGEVWIEILHAIINGTLALCHLPSGRCGLKSIAATIPALEKGHLPSGRCGLKSRRTREAAGTRASPPFGEVWIEMTNQPRSDTTSSRHLPSGRCGLKLFLHLPDRPHHMSPPFGEVWIEILCATRASSWSSRHLPSGRCGLKYRATCERGW